MPDLTTLLSKFLNDLYAGTLGVTMPITSIKVGAGTVAAPSVTISTTGNGLYAPGANELAVTINGVAQSDTFSNQIRLKSSLLLGWASGDPTATAADTILSRGAADRLDLASGDSFRINSGVLYGGGLLSRLATVTTISTAGAVTYSAAEVAGGIILRNTNGANRADLVPTAANLLAAMPHAQVGQSLEFTIRNTAGAAETITVTTNTGVTLSGTMTIAQSNSKRFLAVFTNVTAASEAYTLYSLGTVVH